MPKWEKSDCENIEAAQLKQWDVGMSFTDRIFGLEIGRIVFFCGILAGASV